MAKEKNMNQDAANDEEMTVTLTLDDGTDLECVVLTTSRRLIRNILRFSR